MAESIYDQVLEALVGGAYALDALLVQWRRGVPFIGSDAARLLALRQQQMDAATAFQAWWQTHGTATGGPPCPR